MFILFIILILLSTVLYLSFRIYNLSFLKEFKYRRIFIILFLVLLVIFGYFDLINTVVVVIQFTLFLLIFDLINLFANKVFKKNFSYTKIFLSVLVFTIIYMSYGYYLAHHVVETTYIVEANKDIGVDKFRIVQVTDSHIGATMNGDDFIKYMEKINEKNPDIVVVTGDFIDDNTSKEDMIKGCLGLGKLKTKYGVYFIYGNHDKGYFDYRDYNDEDLRKELAKNNVVILEDESLKILDDIILVGRQDSQVRNRKSALDLTENLDKTKYLITLDHEPNDYDNEALANMDLVLSGHTHGGQLFPLGQIGVMAGINDSFYGLEKRENTTFVVSSGIGDWAIKFKTGTISEYVVIDIINKK